MFHNLLIIILLSLHLSLIYTKTHPLPKALESFSYKLQGSDWTGKCIEGKEQSPINIETMNSLCDNSLIFSPTFLHNTDYFRLPEGNLTYTFERPMSILDATNINGILFQHDAIQFHFHSPAEHTIDGKNYDLELHIIHKLNDDDFNTAYLDDRYLTVVSILFKVDDKKGWNPVIEPIVENYNEKNLEINLKYLLGGDRIEKLSYYAYQGSLTTPPCNEIVNWIIIESPQTITKRQLNLLSHKEEEKKTSFRATQFVNGKIMENRRGVQGLNGRVVKKGGFECM